MCREASRAKQGSNHRAWPRHDNSAHPGYLVEPTAKPTRAVLRRLAWPCHPSGDPAISRTGAMASTRKGWLRVLGGVVALRSCEDRAWVSCPQRVPQPGSGVGDDTRRNPEAVLPHRRHPRRLGYSSDATMQANHLSAFQEFERWRHRPCVRLSASCHALVDGSRAFAP